jgi:hypothetical protein
MHDGAFRTSRSRRITTLCVMLPTIAMALMALASCGAQPDPEYWIARSTTREARFWQIYHRGEWRDILLDGMKPPHSVKPYVVNGDNWFVFAGAVDTIALVERGPNMAIFFLEAWNIVWPVRRRYLADGLVDKSGIPYLIDTDFVTLKAYQSWGVNVAGIWWPLLAHMDHPAVEAAERDYDTRGSLLE